MQPDDQGPLDLSMFQDPEFREAFRVLPVFFRVIAHEHDPHHPTRPRLFFTGDVRDGQTMVGRVEMTSEDHLRWNWVRLRICVHDMVCSQFSSLAERMGRQSGGIILHPLEKNSDRLTLLVVVAFRSVGCGRLTVSSGAGRRSSTTPTIQSVSTELLLYMHLILIPVTAGPLWLHKVKSIPSNSICL